MSDRPFYNVLEPIYYLTGKVVSNYNRQGILVRQELYGVEWNVIGQAHDMEDAKRQFGGFPILERAEELVGYERQQKLLHQARRKEAAAHNEYEKASRVSYR